MTHYNARRAHNPKVVSSNLAPATNSLRPGYPGLFFFKSSSNQQKSEKDRQQIHEQENCRMEGICSGSFPEKHVDRAVAAVPWSRGLCGDYIRALGKPGGDMALEEGPGARELALAVHDDDGPDAEEH